MAVGSVDRDEWAKVVQELLDAHTRGKKEPFARLVGVNPRTVHSWLRREMAVTEPSVRQVAAACGVNPIELLIRVGFYEVSQLPPARHEELDDERRRVLATDLDDEQKAEILAALDEMQAADEALIAQLREKDRQRRAERVAVLIAQKQSA